MRADIEEFSAYIKVSDLVDKGTINDDFLREQLTAALTAKVALMAKEHGEINVYIEPPTFLDWLFKRYKVKKVAYTIAELAKVSNLALPDNIKVIEFDI